MNLVIPILMLIRYNYALFMIPRKLKSIGVYDYHQAKRYSIPSFLLLSILDCCFIALEFYFLVNKP